MAILWMDGLDTYSSSADLALRYPADSVTLSTTGGRFNGGFGGGMTVALPHTTGALIVGGAFGPYNQQYSCLRLYNSTAGAGTAELTLQYNTTTLRLYRGSTVGTLLATATVPTVSGVWHHVEVKALIADSGGSCEVRVDGVTVINYSGDTRASSTGTAGLDGVQWSAYSGAIGGWDDIYALDTSGSVANDWLNDCRINTLAPTSDAAVQFTRSTGASNYLTVDEGRMNSDTDYVQSATVGHIDRFGYADLAAAAVTVHGVQVVTWCKKTDATARTMRNILVSGATTSNGASFALTTSYLPMVTTLTLNPDGSVAWTPTTVNAATAGFEALT